MKRKKINPNRIPISPKNYDLEEIKKQATNGKVLQTWAVLLAALSNLEGMTTEKLLDIWQQIDQAPTQIYTFAETEQELVKIRELTGVSLSLQRSSSGIHTEGDLAHFIRTTTANAVSAAFAMLSGGSRKHRTGNVEWLIAGGKFPRVACLWPERVLS